LYSDVVQFIVMFAGFIILFLFCIDHGGISFIAENVPPEHLELTGGASPVYILVWFLIAMWTFADPGFHQRCYAAKTANVAKWGIIISVFFWFLFDFLTTSAGLYSAALIKDIPNPVQAYPLLADLILPSGFKGLFYAALFATIISTLNSFLFLSGTTIGRDFIFKLKKDSEEKYLKSFTIIGLIISGVLATILALSIPSVIEIWYLIGSFCIPSIILPIAGAYYPQFKISGKIVVIEMISAASASLLWHFILRDLLSFNTVLAEIEPMIAGMSVAIIIHIIGISLNRRGG
jgi:solute:Na+ symporter, SSS family